MKTHRKSKQATELLKCAEARVKLFEDIEQGCVLYNKITTRLKMGAEEKRLAKLVNDALLFVLVRQLDGFRDFLAEMKKVDTEKDTMGLSGEGKHPTPESR